MRIDLDHGRSLLHEPGSGHNRWHPMIPPRARVSHGQEVVFETRDALDGQITEASQAAELAGFDYGVCHPLTGPVYIEGAEPGDILAVETLAIEPAEFGWTFVAPNSGFLGDDEFEPFIARWTISRGFAQSPDIPGVVIAGSPFLGVMGIAPSEERLRAYSQREQALASAGADVSLPSRASAIPALGLAAAEGLKTQPPRETGGNLDIKHLGVGSTLLLSVQVEGALFSAGDMHFAQGDGECCITAIETAGAATLRFSLRKAATLRWRQQCPTAELSRLPRAPEGPWFATTGMPVDQAGRNHDNDIGLAARNACRAMIDYLTSTRGYTREQAYVILSVAVDLHLSSVVNSPNPVVTALLPMSIFVG